jgi:lysozyme family protein
MAQFEQYFNQLIKHEGGYVDHPSDPGGATNLGITLATWRTYGRDLTGDGKIDKADVKKITKAHALPVYKRAYWDKLSLDFFHSQSLAEIVFDHGVNAGISRAAKMLQYVLNGLGATLLIDGGIGAKTIQVLHTYPAKEVFEAYKKLRSSYYLHRSNHAGLSPAEAAFFRNELQVSPSAKAAVFRKGWLNRVASFTYQA